MSVRLALIFLLTLAYSINALSEVAIIANKDVVEKSLSKRDLRAIFSMKKKRWKNGREISVFVLADKHPLHSSFTKEVLKTYPYHLRKIWDRQVYSGTGSAPVQLTSEQEMIERVKKTPDSIGYINKNEGVGLVKVIGRK